MSYATLLGADLRGVLNFAAANWVGGASLIGARLTD